MGDLLGSIDCIGFRDNFCIVMGDSQLAHCQNCEEKTAMMIASSSINLWAVVQGHLDQGPVEVGLFG